MINYLNVLKFLRDTTKLEVNVLITDTESRFTFMGTKEPLIVSWTHAIPHEIIERQNEVDFRHLSHVAHCKIAHLVAYQKNGLDSAKCCIIAASTIAASNITILVNCDLFSEGFDVPGVECVVMNPDLKGPNDARHKSNRYLAVKKSKTQF